MRMLDAEKTVKFGIKFELKVSFDSEKHSNDKTETM